MGIIVNTVKDIQIEKLPAISDQAGIKGFSSKICSIYENIGDELAGQIFRIVSRDTSKGVLPSPQTQTVRLTQRSCLLIGHNQEHRSVRTRVRLVEASDESNPRRMEKRPGVYDGAFSTMDLGS